MRLELAVSPLIRRLSKEQGSVEQYCKFEFDALRHSVLNLYGYALNDPISLLDRNGLELRSSRSGSDP